MCALHLLAVMSGINISPEDEIHFQVRHVGAEDKQGSPIIFYALTSLKNTSTKVGFNVRTLLLYTCI